MNKTGAPPIETLPAGTARPLWSVMIPTFNCAAYLRETLASVLAQDPGPERMQIEVVDDCSTKDDPAAVVKEFGHGRVSFFRKAKNEGAIENFNTCISRSRGHLVHILHGDDFVLPGFYSHLSELVHHHPNAALYATRSFYVDESSIILGVSSYLNRPKEIVKDATPFYYETPLQCPGIVVPRSFYESTGGFLPDLVHTADCEMWARASSIGGSYISEKILAGYRVFAANDSGRLQRTAENLRDIERLYRLFESRFSDFDLLHASRLLLHRASLQIDRFHQSGDRESEIANLQFWQERASVGAKIRRLLKKLIGYLKKIFRQGS